MAISPAEVVKYLKESTLRRVDEDEDVKEGDKVSFKEDDKDFTGKVIEIHDENARVKVGEDDIHTVKVSDLKKSEEKEEGGEEE